MIIEEITTESPEPKMELGSRSRGTHPSTVLGFFVNPQKYCIFGNISQQEHPFFIYTSRKGKKYAKGGWGNLDEFSTFIISHQFDIVGSSNGFLLCRKNNPIQDNMQNYIIGNPITAQFRHLPCNPRNMNYFSAPLAYICKGTNNNGTSQVDEIHHQVVLARVLSNHDHMHFKKLLELETFCSFENKWSTEATIVVDSPFTWDLENVPAFAIDEVIFWHATFRGLFGYDSALLAYDRQAKSRGLHARLIVVPPRQDDRRFKCHSDHFGPSEGKVYYAREDYDNFEIWVLEDYKRRDYNWIMKHRVSLNIPEFVRVWLGIDDRSCRLVGDVKSFHPQKSALVFMTMGVRTFWYDIECRQIKGKFHSFKPLMSRFFLYEWPQFGHFDDH